MFSWAIAFLLGDLFLQMQQTLPSNALILILLAIASLLLIYQSYSQYVFTFLAVMIIGFTYSAWCAHQILTYSLSRDDENKLIMISGHIASMPIYSNGRAQFNFKTSATEIRLSWDQPKTSLQVGDKWRLLVKLKRFHANQNKGGMDFEAWAIQQKLRAKGYVVNSADNILLKREWYRFPLESLRAKILSQIVAVLPKSDTSAWLIGLIIGERNGIATDDWQVLRNTGTNHLMAVAGLHIGIIAGFIHWLTLRLLRRRPGVALIFPMHFMASLLALIVAVYYSALAGFSIPTQRASFMLIVLVLVLVRKKQTTSWHVWSLALLMVLLVNPLCILSDSFWLSFITIALIIFGMRGRINPQGFWWHYVRVQWVIAVGLIPLSLAFFQECSLVSVIVNSIAIPWLGFLVLPFCLLAGVVLPISHLLGKALLCIADKSLALLWCILNWFSHLSFAVWHHAMPNAVVLLVAIIGVILLLLPKGVNGRWFGFIFLLPIVLFKTPHPNKGQYWLTLLDVGQGLSVVVRTEQHVLLFDTGPKFGKGMDTGEQIIVPYLRSQNINYLDTVVVSHSDNDHSGGLSAVVNAIPIKSIFTSVPHELPVNNANYCLSGKQWNWDGVNFQFVYPDKDSLGYGNDSCCVLMIDNGSKRVLLTADIEAFAEKKIVTKNMYPLAADILVAPHHGSKTSSSDEFLQAIRPTYVLYSTGYLNKFHFPHEVTIKKYETRHVKQLDTAKYGSIEFKIDRNALNLPERYRLENKHYWLD